MAAVEGYEIPSVPRRRSAGNGYACRAGITMRISPHSLRHNLMTAGLDVGVPLLDLPDAAMGDMSRQNADHCRRSVGREADSTKRVRRLRGAA